MAHQPDVLLPSSLVGPSLTVAGLAAWVFLHSAREDEAARCGEIQDVLNAALAHGEHDVLVARPVVERATDLWERAADILARRAAVQADHRSASEHAQQIERLRMRARSLRRLLE
jgi:hypothetical protein